ncbi:MFP1 attachment factor 1-like [Cornus florida]|uniref:MFP1 attachment factor 1-like n=1 Tax=Cornus florida TaxID=4283 RepID=UPI002897ECAB|nr:MFP1 attachment factor 1-like [Cornus florida]
MSCRSIAALLVEEGKAGQDLEEMTQSKEPNLHSGYRGCTEEGNVNRRVAKIEKVKKEQEPKTSKRPKPEKTQHQEIKNTEKIKSFSIWPPSQRTRDAVINHLIETLSTSSVLSKRYGSIPPDEAAATARRIEVEAFAASSGCGLTDDIKILQVYSKDISKRILVVVKSRSASAKTPTTTASEETSIEYEY